MSQATSNPRPVRVTRATKPQVTRTCKYQECRKGMEGQRATFQPKSPRPEQEYCCRECAARANARSDSHRLARKGRRETSGRGRAGISIYC